MPSHQPERSQELQDLLRRLRPKILELLRRHRVVEERAAEVVHDTFMALAVRWGRVGNREAWVLGTIEARCRGMASSPLAADSPDGDTPEDPDGSDGERRS